MKKYLILLLFAFIGNTVFSQARYFDERYVYSQHNIYPVLINPGAIGAGEYKQLLVNYRNTWAGVDDSPTTFTINYNGDMGNRLGFGASVVSDSYGALNLTKGSIGLSYSIESPTNKIGFGLSTEYVQHGIRSGSLGNVDLGDPVIQDRLDGVQYVDATFGIFGTYQEKLVYGLSFPSLISSKISDSGPETDRNLGYIVQLGYKFKSMETGISMVPMMTYKNLMNTPTHVDLNVLFGFLDDKLLGGVNYTLGAERRFGFLIGTQVEAININYSYNLSNSDFQVYNSGIHEVTVGLNFGGGTANQIATKIMSEDVMTDQ